MNNRTYEVLYSETERIESKLPSGYIIGGWLIVNALWHKDSRILELVLKVNEDDYAMPEYMISEEVLLVPQYFVTCQQLTRNAIRLFDRAKNHIKYSGWPDNLDVVDTIF